MKRIGFNEHYGLQTAVCNGTKTKTRRTEKCLNKLYAADKELGEPLEIYQQEITRKGIVLRTNAGIIAIHTNYKIDEEVAVKASGLYIYHQLQQRYGETSDAAIGFKEMYEGMAFWTNKMFTPAALLPDHIIITGLRIERLQDISDEDCLEEGIKQVDMGFSFRCPRGVCAFSYPKEAFASLIDAVSGSTWERNPWVLVYSFKLIK